MLSDLTPLPPGAPADRGGAGPRPARALSGREKAAIVVRLLLAQGAKLPLHDLPDDLQAALTLQVGQMRPVDRATLESVVEEFCARLDAIGLSFPGGIDGALDLLDGHISPAAAARLRLSAGLQPSEDPWIRIGGIAAERLGALVAEESTEVAAIILSKIAVSKAADILGRLPGEKARRIAYAVSLTGATAPETVQRIGQSLLAQLAAEPPRAFDAGPVERIGAILNFSPSATRDEVLDGLQAADAGFAEQVRKAIFTFANIPARIDPRDIPKVLRAVEQPVLVKALAAAQSGPEAASAEFILANISQRMAASLREEMEAAGKVGAKDGEAAMGAVVAAIRELEAAGEVFLVAGEEEGE